MYHPCRANSPERGQVPAFNSGRPLAGLWQASGRPLAGLVGGPAETEQKQEKEKKKKKKKKTEEGASLHLLYALRGAVAAHRYEGVLPENT